MKKTWEEEKRGLLGERAVLQDATKRLNSQIRDAKSEINKATDLHKVESRNRHDIEGVSFSFIIQYAMKD